MAQTKLLKDSRACRWAMLLLVSFTMLAFYAVTDEFSSLKTFLETHNGWDSTAYGTFSSAYSLLNVFCGMLIFGGIILDKMGVRFTGLLCAGLCLVGIIIKYWAMSHDELALETINFLGTPVTKQVFLAMVGYAIFGVGSETAGVTVTKCITKWFIGYEIALAMGVQVALARLGSGAALAFAPMIANHFGSAQSVVFVGVALVLMGTIFFIVYNVYDRKLDNQVKENKLASINADDDEEQFHAKDILDVLKNPAFWLIAVLCVLFYSAVFPFLKYASDLMVNKFGVAQESAGIIPSLLPFGCIILTPLFGGIYDKKGHGADLMMLGAIILTIVHLLFAAPFIKQTWMAFVLIVLLGIGFALLPSAMWPSIAKIIPTKQLGTAMSLTFFIQNIGLWGVPLLIGNILDKYCITGQIADGELIRNTYNYTLPMLIFALFGLISVLVSFGLKLLDKKKNFGIQNPTGGKK